jgi:hypothetical protein
MLTNFFRKTIAVQRLPSSIFYRFASEGEGDGQKSTGTEITKENSQLII